MSYNDRRPVHHNNNYNHRRRNQHGFQHGPPPFFQQHELYVDQLQHQQWVRDQLAQENQMLLTVANVQAHNQRMNSLNFRNEYNRNYPPLRHGNGAMLNSPPGLSVPRRMPLSTIALPNQGNGCSHGDSQGGREEMMSNSSSNTRAHQVILPAEKNDLIDRMDVEWNRRKQEWQKQNGFTSRPSTMPTPSSTISSSMSSGGTSSTTSSSLQVLSLNGRESDTWSQHMKKASRNELKEKELVKMIEILRDGFESLYQEQQAVLEFYQIINMDLTEKGEEESQADEGTC